MTIYIATLGIVFILSIIARYMDEKPKGNSKIYSKIFTIYTFIILSGLSGLRNGVGSDFFSYKYFYIDAFKINIVDQRDFGYLILNRLVHVISDNPQWIFIVTALITNGLIIYTIKKKSEMFEISVYLYLASYMYFSTLNGIRQWLAAAILFSGIKYLFCRDFKKYIIVVLIASTIHQTALIMLLFYFICNGRFKSKKNIITIIIGIGIYIYYMPFVDILMKSMEGSKIYNDYHNGLEIAGQGSNILRFFVATVPVVLCFLFYEYINKYNDKKVDILMNLSLINSLVMLLGTRHWIFARFLMYFEIYNLLLYPIIICGMLKKERRLLYYLFITIYLIFCVLILKSGDSHIVPYKFNLDIW